MPWACGYCNRIHGSKQKAEACELKCSIRHEMRHWKRHGSKERAIRIGFERARRHTGRKFPRKR